MKKITKIFFISIFITVVCLLLSCCQLDKEISVTYIYNNGQADMTATCQKIEKPQDPVRDGYIFVGWCTDAELTDFYDFSSYPKSDITLYAYWMRDYRKLSNEISESAIAANVMIRAGFYSGMFSLTPERQSQGSGVIYMEDDDFYYILSNDHVVDISDSYFTASYSVYDAYGNEYNATLLFKDKSYDLAALKIRKKPKYQLAVLDFEYEVPSWKETVITVSAPKGQLNTLLYGELIAYKSIELDGVKGDSSDISFEVLWHTSPAKNGSSGSALINSQMKIIGINYAVASDENGEFLYCFAIPSARIKEFLEIYSENIS